MGSSRIQQLRVLWFPRAWNTDRLYNLEQLPELYKPRLAYLWSGDNKGTCLEGLPLRFSGTASLVYMLSTEPTHSEHSLTLPCHHFFHYYLSNKQQEPSSGSSSIPVIDLDWIPLCLKQSGKVVLLPELEQSTPLVLILFQKIVLKTKIGEHSCRD